MTMQILMFDGEVQCQKCLREGTMNGVVCLDCFCLFTEMKQVQAEVIIKVVAMNNEDSYYDEPNQDYCYECDEDMAWCRCGGMYTEQEFW